MKTRSILSLLLILATGPVLADKSGDPAHAPKGDKDSRAEADTLKNLKQGVQITEIGNTRAVFVFAEGAEHVETRVTEAFSNVDFRVFPSPVVVEGRIQPSALHKIGNERYCDMVVFTRLTTEEKPALGSLKRFDVEASVQVYNPMSEELMVSTTVRSSEEAKKQKKMLTHADEGEARRAATNIALDAAVTETITKVLEKAHKMIVHEAQLKGVLDHQHLLDILNYTAKLEGVYNVRQISYDKQTGLAVIEIIAAPQTEPYWRAYINNLPKHEILIQKGREPRVILNPELRKKHGIDFDRPRK